MNVHTPPKVAERVARCLLLALSSNQSGEIVAAVTAARRALDGAEITIHAVASAIETGLAAPPPAGDPTEPHRPHRQEPSRDWRAEAKYCHRHRDQLAEHERGLIDTLLKWRGTPTPKQMDWLARIVQRIRAKGN